MNSVFVDWLAEESTVGGKITSIAEDEFGFEIADQIVQVNKSDVEIPEMGVCIPDEIIFDKILSSLVVGQSLRIGSGQWTFYSEPDEIRYIISESSIRE